MPETPIRRFYRIVPDQTPTDDDFASDEALGEPPPDRPSVERRLMWQGISVFATEAQAASKARAIPVLGGYVAELAIPEGAALTYARTGGRRSRGHHTLWGDAGEIRRCVVRVVRV